jgi:replicative DNA helicase
MIFSREIESTVLGYLIVNNDLIDKYTGVLSNEDFTTEDHKTVYRTILDLHKENVCVDLITLKNRLSGTISIPWLASLIDGVHRSENIIYYVNILKEKSALRSLVRISERVKEAALLGESPSEIVSKVERDIRGLKVRATIDVSDMPTVSKEIKEYLERMKNGGFDKEYVYTGIDSVDTIIGGVSRTSLVVLAARPSVGKTAMALQIGRNIAKSGSGVIVFSLEMGRTELGSRLLSMESMVDANKIKRASFLPDELERVNCGLAEIEKLPIYIHDEMCSDIEGMTSKVKSIIQSVECRLIIIDYIQLMNSSVEARQFNRHLELSLISREMKMLSRSIGIPILCLSQLKRTDGIPKLSDLRDSGSIEENADIVIMLHRDTDVHYAEDKVLVLIEKNRNGQTGECSLAFLKNYARYENIISGKSINESEKYVNDEDTEYA